MTAPPPSLLLGPASGLLLRPLQPDDAPAFLSLVLSHRAHLEPWIPWVERFQSREDAEAFVGAILRQYSDGSGLQLAVIHSGSLCGMAGFHKIHPLLKRAWLAYWLTSPFLRKGTALLACQALVRHGTETLKLRSFEIHCATGNTASRRLAEKLGFMECGILPAAETLRGTPVDHSVYRLETFRTGPPATTPRG